MKRSEFIKKVLKSKDNTVFTTKEQVQNSLELFEKLGMLPPIHYPYTCGCSMRGVCPTCTPNEYKMYNTWEPEDET